MGEFFIIVAKAAIVFAIIPHLAIVCTWFERKGSALIQDRIGANRAGAIWYAEDFSAFLGRFIPKLIILPFHWMFFKPIFFVLRWLGILGFINTGVCDAVKAIFKEDFIPEGTSNFIHCLAPFMAVAPVFIAFAVVPLAPDFELFGYHIRAQVASLDAGILFVFAMGSIAVYGVALAGWTGNNKYSLLGGLRASAQMISYELAMGLTFVSVILMYGTLDLYEMVEKQKQVWNWGIFPMFPAFIVLFIVGMAETKRNPFDLPEAESELAAGYFTEYSGMKFLLFWLGEFAEIALFSLILSLLFLGGWHLPWPLDKLIDVSQGTWWAALIGHVVLMTKVILLSFLQIIIRWTLPRFRYDQLMNLGWKILLPVSLANLMIYSALKVAL